VNDIPVTVIGDNMNETDVLFNFYHAEVTYFLTCITHSHSIYHTGLLGIQYNKTMFVNFMCSEMENIYLPLFTIVIKCMKFNKNKFL